ncbi:MAG: flippase, partial [Candidatus Acidoferrales bacterium]
MTSLADKQSPEGAAGRTQRLARGTLVFVAGVVFGKMLLLLTQLLLGRVLGPAGYGLYTLGFSLFLVVQWVASLGLDWGVLRYCSLYRARGQPELVQRTLLSAAVLGFGSSLLVASLLAAVAGPLAEGFFAEPALAGVVRLFAVGLPFYVLMRLATTFFQSRQQYGRMTFIQHGVQPVVHLVFLLGAFALGWSLLGAVGAFLASVGLAAALGLGLVRREMPGLTWARPERAPLRLLLRYSLGLTFIGLTYQLLLRIPAFLLGYLGTAEQVGVYAAAANLAMVLSLTPALFAAPFLPVIVELWEKGELDELKQKYQTVVRWSLSVLLPLFLLLVLLRKEVIGLFGPQFAGGSPILVLLSVAWVVYFAKGSVATLLDMTGRQTLDLLNLTGAAVVSIVLNIFLIPRYGALGAGLATTLAILLWAAVEYVEVRRLYRLWPWGEAVGALLAVTLVSGVLGALLYAWVAWP